MRLLQTLALATTMLVATASVGNCRSFKTGSELLDECSEANSGFNSGVCIGYIIAIADVSNCSKDVGGKYVGGFSWQPPEGVTIGQLEKVVAKWLNNHPEKLHFGASGLVADALKTAFPCN